MFKTMKEIGELFGISSHKVGSDLKAAGYRTSEGKPSSKAFEHKMVETKGDDFGHYIWIWHVEKTKQALINMGRNLVIPEKPSGPNEVHIIE